MNLNPTSVLIVALLAGLVLALFVNRIDRFDDARKKKRRCLGTNRQIRRRVFGSHRRLPFRDVLFGIARTLNLSAPEICFQLLRGSCRSMGASFQQDR